MELYRWSETANGREAMRPASKVHAQVTRRLAATPEQVFDAWLDAQLVRRWMGTSAARGVWANVTRVEIDPRVGGIFSFVDRQDGQELDHRGEYLEIDRPRRLVFTWGIPSLSPASDKVTLEVMPSAGGCQVTLTHELPTQWIAFQARCAANWGAMLDAVQAMVTEGNRM